MLFSIVTPVAAYGALRYWLPWVSGFTAAYKVHASIKKGVAEWANRFLSNHLAHLQTGINQVVVACESTASTVKEHTSILNEIRQDGRQAATDLAVLKDRV